MASIDLVKFLTDRLNEDEATARGLLNATRLIIGGMPNFYGVGGPAAEAYWRHFDTGRMLADVALRRGILEIHVDRAECDRCAWHDREFYPCETVRLLAMPYATHPDYCTEWKVAL